MDGAQETLKRILLSAIGDHADLEINVQLLMTIKYVCEELSIPIRGPARESFLKKAYTLIRGSTSALSLFDMTPADGLVFARRAVSDFKTARVDSFKGLEYEMVQLLALGLSAAGIANYKFNCDANSTGSNSELTKAWAESRWIWFKGMQYRQTELVFIICTFLETLIINEAEVRRPSTLYCVI